MMMMMTWEFRYYFTFQLRSNISEVLRMPDRKVSQYQRNLETETDRCLLRRSAPVGTPGV